MAALAFAAGTAIVACGDPAIDGNAADAGATSTTAWGDLAGLGTAVSVPMPVDTEGTPPSGSIVAGAADARLMWSFRAEGIEFMAVHDGVVYVTTDTAVVAASLADGTVLWRHSDDDYYSDGESRVAVDGDELWVVAPYNANIHLDPATGRTIGVDALTESMYPDDFTPLATPAPKEWTVTNTDVGALAALPDGRTAWQLVVPGGEYGTDGPVVADGSTTLVAAYDDHVYAISART